VKQRNGPDYIEFTAPVEFNTQSLNDVFIPPAPWESSAPADPAPAISERTTVEPNTVSELLAEESTDDLRAESERAERIRGVAVAAVRDGRLDAIRADAMVSQAVASGTTPNDFDLQLLRGSRPTAGPALQGNPGRGIRAHDRLVAAALKLGGHADFVAETWGDEVNASIRRPHGWVGLAETCLRANSQYVPDTRDQIIRAAFSTAGLANVVSNAVNKLSMRTYLDASSGWRALVKRVSVPDFKQWTAVRLSAAARLEKLPPSGEIKHGNLMDEAYTFQAATYAKMFGLTRNDIINDDLSVLDDLPVILGNESARSVADSVFALITGNAGSFFGTGHANQIATALSADSIFAAALKLRTAADRDGRIIGFRPTTLVVPAALEMEARMLLRSSAVQRDQAADNQPTANPVADLNLALVVEPRLDATSATDWYLWGAPDDGVILAAFLDGRDFPTVESQEMPFNQLGVQWRVVFDYGCNLAEYRAAVKSDVTP
jgi:hypothetical protein